MNTNRNNRNAAGFSVAEMLVAVLLILIVSAVVAAGMPMARQAYEKAVDAANAQTLLSTTVTTLRSELGEASDITTTSTTVDGVAGKELESFRSARTGARTELSNPDSGIMVKDYADNSLPRDHLLVTTQAATKRLSTSYSHILYDDASGVFTITDLCVKRNGTEIAALETLRIKTVNP